MIILAKVVPYGGNAVRYAMEKEKAKTVRMHHLAEDLDPTAIWYTMKHHCQLHQADRTRGRKLERFMVTFVVSPSKEEAQNFTQDDWARLQDEALNVLDSIQLLPKGAKKKVKTNFQNSMNVGALHSDSKSGTLHLHIDCCRVDMDGNTNDVHDIHERAMKAAEIINMRHGWLQPQEIHDLRQKQIAECCERTLRTMHEFSFPEYFNRLRAEGYRVKCRYATGHRLVGYTIGKDASVFKASLIGRKYMVSQLPSTWRKMHPAPAQDKVKPSSPVTPTTIRPARPAVSTPTFTQPRVAPVPRPSFQTYDIKAGNDWKTIRISDDIDKIFKSEVQLPDDNEKATAENVIHVAMLLFAGYVDGATSMSESCGGGGSSPDSGWGKKDDEDDRKFARRCLQMAHSMCKPKKRYGLKR